MESLSMCEKNLDWFGGKKFKKSLLQNTLKNSPFDMEILALKYVDKTTDTGRKN